jgi:hypothetical protein
MTRTAINDSFLALGLLLQSSLLALLFTRRIARRLPFFATLLAFYLIRSALLFTLSGHIDSDAYTDLYNGLSVLDLLLQLIVAIEIAVRLTRVSGGFATRRDMLFVLPCLAFGATWLTCQMLPIVTRLPPDRLQLFNWFALLLLGIWSLTLPTHDPPALSLLRRVSVGLAVYGLLGVGATIARTLAAADRNARIFAESSYILPIAWLLIVPCWIVILKPAILKPRQDSPEPPPATA